MSLEGGEREESEGVSLRCAIQRTPVKSHPGFTVSEFSELVGSLGELVAQNLDLR